jgi:hypothetical protein
VHGETNLYVHVHHKLTEPRILKNMEILICFCDKKDQVFDKLKLRRVFFIKVVLPPKYSIIVNGCTACLFLHLFLLPFTPSLTDYVLYFTKSFANLFKMWFLIDMLLWVGLYWTNLFWDGVVFWEILEGLMWVA